MQRKIVGSLAGLWLILLTGLSSFSDYQIRRPGALMNFDVATMLTPIGLFRHFVLGQARELAPYYLIPVAGRAPLFESMESVALVASFFAVSIVGLFLLRSSVK